MLNLNYFIHKVWKTVCNNILDSPSISHIYSKITISPNYSENEKSQVNKRVKQMADIEARLVDQNKIEHQTVFPARVDKQNKVNQAIDEINYTLF